MPNEPIHPTRDGQQDHGTKTRYGFDAKLHRLGDGDTPAATLQRLMIFLALFAFRKHGGIVTRNGQGPRAWTALPVPLANDHVIRHLLADRLPGLNPIWYGARSFRTTKFVCIDVDADRANPDSPSFSTRCEEVERAFRRLGADPANPFHVRVLPSPSGGRHYYLFLDKAYDLEHIHPILHAAGFHHRKGHTELFPSPTQGFRLPFGHIPGTQHDPKAWIQFVDDYRSGEIFRFSLQTLRQRLGNHEKRWEQQRQSRLSTRQPTPLGIPKQHRHAPLPAIATSNERYEQLLEAKINCPAYARELMSLGILREGTRTQVLKILATHLVWVRGVNAANAAAELTAWAMNPAHESKDIRADLENRTNHVAVHIARMCQWYDSHRQSTPRPTHHEPNTTTETQPIAEGSDQPDWRFQSFTALLARHAKCVGTPQPDGTYLVALPINSVVRKWPGCSAHHYKPLMDAAIRAGVLELHQEKWHNRRGTGRARIYRVIIQANTTTEQTHEPRQTTPATPIPEQVVTESVPPTRNADHAEHRTNTTAQTDRTGPKPPPALPQESANGNLGTSAHRSDPMWAERDRPRPEFPDDNKTVRRPFSVADGRAQCNRVARISRDSLNDPPLPKCTRCKQPACQVDKAKPLAFPRNELSRKFSKSIQFQRPPNLNPPVRLIAILDFEILDVSPISA